MTCGILISLDIAYCAYFIYISVMKKSVYQIMYLGILIKIKILVPLLEVLDKEINKFLLEQVLI